MTRWMATGKMAQGSLKLKNDKEYGIFHMLVELCMNPSIITLGHS